MTTPGPTKPGPAPLGLRLPAGLAAADPAALRRRATDHSADASAASAQAQALRTAVVRLVPAAWLGLGALSFAGGALLQAAGLEEIAAASSDLASALLALAAGIERAQTDALAAVRAGQRLDDEVAADEARADRRPEPERPGPDPIRISVQVDAAAQLRMALAVAEEHAEAAWRRAAAAFDFVAYRMPALAGRMSGTGSDSGSGNWSPSSALAPVPDGAWRELVGPSPVCVSGGYSGAGALLGPDGRRYPLVVPWVLGPDVQWTADLVGAGTTGLDGADPGWHQLGVRVGIDSFAPAVSTATKAAVLTAGLAGNAPQLIGRLRPDLLPRLRWSSSGVPSVAPATAIPVPRSGGTGQIPRSGFARADGELRWTPETRVPGPATPVGPNAVALADSGLSGLATARRMDDSRTAAYRATFEENDDGRIRARLTTYQIRDQQSGPSVLANDVAMTPDGRLRRDPVRYRPAPDGITSDRITSGPG